MRREMTKAHEVECVALARDIRALLAERQVSPPMAKVVLINTLVAMIKHLEEKTRWKRLRRIWFARCNGRSRNLNKPQPVRRNRGVGCSSSCWPSTRTMTVRLWRLRPTTVPILLIQMRKTILLHLLKFGLQRTAGPYSWVINGNRLPSCGMSCSAPVNRRRPSGPRLRRSRTVR